MHKGKLVFAQLNEHLPKPIVRDCVKRYAERYPTLNFSHWDQLLCMMFAQLTARTSLRDIELCLGSQQLLNEETGEPEAQFFFSQKSPDSSGSDPN
jgi:hypothetical protein